MSAYLRPSFQAVPVVPVQAGTNPAAAAPKMYYANSNAPQQHQITTPIPPTITPQHSLHQRLPTNTSMGLESALEGLEVMDFSERRITSDISTLDCESVKADPHFNPAVEETPFVPPLEITIPVNLSHLAALQPQHTRRASFDSASLRHPPELTRRLSCQSRLEMSQANKAKSGLILSHKMAIKLASNNGGVLPPSYQAHSSNEESFLDPSLQDYANGAGAVEDQLSYYTSPTDLYTSDDSEPIVQQETKKGLVKRELKKIIVRFQRSKAKKSLKTMEPVDGVVGEGPVKDYDSFGSERGFC